MHILKGHPLITHDVFHMGATKEVLFVMGFCEKFFGECNGERIEAIWPRGRVNRPAHKI
jgi:hypothetical protein